MDRGVKVESQILVAEREESGIRRPKNVGNFVPQVSREGDFHLNPKTTSRTNPTAEMLRCSMCRNYSSGDLLECYEKGHPVCEDCYTLCLSHGEAFCAATTPSGLPCNRRFLAASKLLRDISSTFEFRCISEYCEDTIKGSSLWNDHIKSCQFLNAFVKCPVELCKCSKVSRDAFLEHCSKQHGVSPVTPGDGGHLDVTLCPDELKTTALLGVVEQDERVIYLVGRQEKTCLLRLAAFTLNRDPAWAASRRILVLIKNLQQFGVTALLKINPSERDWDDLKLFGRSQSFHFQSLENVFQGSSNDGQRRLLLQVFIKDAKSIMKYALTPPETTDELGF